MHSGVRACTYTYVLCMYRDPSRRMRIPVPYAARVHAEMTSLSPPGITNEGNICFASSILHCLLNQQVFIRVLDRVKLQHSPRCNECQQGLFECYKIAKEKVCSIYYTEGTRRGQCTCIIAALHALKCKYIYKPTVEVLSSADLVTSLCCKTIIITHHWSYIPIHRHQ